MTRVAPGPGLAADRDQAPRAAARAAAASLGWNIAGSAVAVLLQLAYTAYTGRMVAASCFGAYAIALTVIQLLGYFANGGLSTYLLRTERLTWPMVRAAWQLGASCGLLCFAVVEVCAPLSGVLWRMPELPVILRLLGCQFLLQPGALVALAAVRRLGLARSAVAAELAGQAVGMTCAVLLLARGWNPFALAVTQPTAAVVSLVIALLCLARRPPPAGRPMRVRDLLASSGFLTGYSLAQFATNSAPMWIVGRLLGPSSAGSYSRAYIVTVLPLTFLDQGLKRAVTPVLAERRGQRRAFGRAVERTVCTSSAAAFGGFGALAGIGPAALSLLLGPGWNTAAALVPVLALAAALTLLCYAGNTVDQVRRAPRTLVGTQLATVAATAAGLALAVAAHRLMWFAAAAAAGQAAGHVVQMFCWHRAGLLHAGRVLRTHAIHAGVGAALGGAAALGAAGRAPAPAVACGLASMVPVALACVLGRTRLPLYSAAVAAGLVRPGVSGPGQVPGCGDSGDRTARGEDSAARSRLAPTRRS